jgi:hypothetical protein
LSRIRVEFKKAKGKMCGVKRRSADDICRATGRENTSSPEQYLEKQINPVKTGFFIGEKWGPPSPRLRKGKRFFVGKMLS